MTSKDYGDLNAVRIEKTDFETGSLPQTSYARPGRILTASPILVTRSLGILTEAKRTEVVTAIANMIA